MTTQTVPARTLADLIEELRRSTDNQARFEKAVTLARGKSDERMSVVAQGVLDNGEAIRELRTELFVVSGKVDEAKKYALESVVVSKATQQAVTTLDSWMRERFATEDVEKGKLLAEIARLDTADSAAEKRDEKVDEEITAMHRRAEAQKKAAEDALAEQQRKHDEAVARAEQDRARGTLKVGIGAALPAALFSFLKEHPGAFETAWKAVGSLFGAH